MYEIFNHNKKSWMCWFKKWVALNTFVFLMAFIKKRRTNNGDWFIKNIVCKTHK